MPESCYVILLSIVSQALDTDTKKAQDVVDGFRDLAKDVNTFGSRWEQIVKQHRVELNTTSIKHLDREISKVASKLKTCVFKKLSLFDGWFY